MRFFKKIKAAAILASIFTSVDKVQELINVYYTETNKKVEIHELMNKTDEEIQSNPKAKEFTEWIVEKILTEL